MSPFPSFSLTQVASAALLLLLACARPAGTDVHVDVARRFQTIEGWEVTLRGWEQDKAADRYDPTWLESSDETVARLVDVAGVNRVRLEVRSGAESKSDSWRAFADGKLSYSSWAKIRYWNVNDNDDPNVIDAAGYYWSELDSKVEHFVLPMRDRLAARGERLFINFCVVDFRKGGPGELDLAAEPEEYAELVLASFEHLKSKYGVTPDSLEIMLEPENAEGWTDRRLGPATLAVERRLAAAGFTPMIVAPSTVDAGHAVRYFERARSDGADINVLSYHSYDLPDDGVRRRIAKAAARAGASTAMLEHLKANVGEFYRDLTQANVSSWQQWAAAGTTDDGDALLVADLTKPAGDRISLARRTRELSQIWRHARIGDVRVAATSGSIDVKPIAFLKPDGAVALMIITDKPRKIVVQGMPQGSYALEWSGRPSGAISAGVVVGGDMSAQIETPGAGVIALVPAP